jgi:lipid-A-disaccharide synthase-like uncharacterized protein
LSSRDSVIYSFFVVVFFSQYLQDESKTKRNIDLNLLEWTHYSMKSHVSGSHLYLPYFVAFTDSIIFFQTWVPSSPYFTHLRKHAFS